MNSCNVINQGHWYPDSRSIAVISGNDFLIFRLYCDCQAYLFP